MESKNKFHFTLLEIVLCVAILGLTATTLGWQIKSIIVNYSFEKNIGFFLTDLKQMQFLALANQVDIEINIKKDQKYYYNITCQDPNRIIHQPYHSLDHVEKISFEEKKTLDSNPMTSQKIVIYHNGRIFPEKVLHFYSKNTIKKKSIDLTSL